MVSFPHYLGFMYNYQLQTQTLKNEKDTMSFK